MDSELAVNYVQSHNRLFLLDYDGTLVNYKTRPERAVPTSKLLGVLSRLCADPANQVVIVSGRDRHFLDQHFEAMPLGVAAEHGYYVRDHGTRWHTTSRGHHGWKQLVRRHMQAAARGLPGVKIETKVSSLVWHYDGAPHAAVKAATRLRGQLRPHLAELGLVAERGRKIVEVRLAGVHKGQVVRRWLKQSRWDFIFAAGDDTTDEDLFAALPADAMSVKVGPGATLARTRLPTPSSLVKLLEDLARSSPALS
jgi:trehalose 6-phosphate synthase/phosphatase